ncbi:MAG: IF-2-associated domain-containing protein [Hyphomonas sp.]
MSDTKDTGGNTGGRKPLTVSRKTSGTVKQSFSHGRSKQVVVETKKRRTVGPGGSEGSGPAPASGGGKAKGEATLEQKLKAIAAQRGITVAELIAQNKCDHSYIACRA